MAICVSYELDIRQIPRECVEECTVGGQDASEPVQWWREHMMFAVDRDRALRCLRGYGAWEPEKLAEMDDDAIAEKILWLACGDFKEYAHEAEEAGFDPWTDDRPDDFSPNCGSDVFCLE